jgi:hypothetical protein
MPVSINGTALTVFNLPPSFNLAVNLDVCCLCGLLHGEPLSDESQCD